MRHSKNNSASSVFTYAERKMLDYGTKELKVGKDSMRQFNDCILCLQIARDPMICQKGHLFCKECIFDNLLSQRKTIDKIKKMNEDKKIGLMEKRARDEESEKLERIKKFKKHTENTSASSSSEPKKDDKMTGDKLSSFWLPSKTPETEKSDSFVGTGRVDINTTSTTTTCPSAKNDKEYQCPSCLKAFSNAVNIACIRTCGHTFCQVCHEEFMSKSKECVKCQSKFKNIIWLLSEGTGFASKGNIKVEKYDFGFQGA